MDGEYNKYPVYHGCLRFDDKNIIEADVSENAVSVSYNGEPIGGSMHNEDVVVLDPNKQSLLSTKIIKAYFSNDVGHGSSETSPLIAVGSSLQKIAFKSELQGLIMRFYSYSSVQCQIYLLKPPVGNVFLVDSGIQQRDITVYCAFPEDGQKFGLDNATFIHNASFPTLEEFMS